MKTMLRVALLAGVAVAMASPASSAEKCQKFGGQGWGAVEGFASFMAEAAMKNAAKAKFGDNVKIGAPTTKCETKGLLYDCKAFAKACG